MYAESDLLMISALQHLIFCERQCALIHLEGQWDENRFTAEGHVLHKRVDQSKSESRRDVRTASALRIRSLSLGLTGVADMVEFHQKPSATDEAGLVIAVPLPNAAGLWAPFPVEYKRGHPKEHRADEVQLCAQALCLEEMLSVYIPAGALYYGETRRRADVVFDTELRQLTQDTANRLHQMLSSGITSPPFDTAHCSSCSLAGICRPDLTDRRSAKKWLHQQVENALS